MTDAGVAISPLLPDLLAAGGISTEYHGRTLVRHFGDPSREYAAATEGVAVFDRSHRARLIVSGRAPGQMLGGVLTGVMPDAPTGGDDVAEGVGTYHAVLTPKGKMVSDLWLYRLGDMDEEVYLLDVPVAGLSGLLEHFGRFLPPRFAAVRDVSSETASISIVGPEATAIVARLALGLRVEPATLDAAREGAWFRAGGEGPSSETELRGMVVTRTAEVWPPAWTVYGPVDALRSLWAAAVADGARAAGLGVWGTLRVEAGRPVFGTDMDESTLPPEAGIVERAIDHGKGCYTGQEVIVRIRDRGHVNRQLRVLELGDVPAPVSGSELLAVDGSGKVVGHLTSVVQSPKSGGVLAMAYVRRGVREARLGDHTVTVPADE